ncbi:MAG: twin-arginine translocase TatA/TatE family subunit [Pedobacter sp.]|nr:twin-arginine translocase TatA/TatE family subunit [Pedobacter sp.]
MGGGEIALIMVAILLLFGGKKLPELARGLGKGIREFKDASEGVKREIHRNINAVDLDNEQKDDGYSDPSITDVAENHSEYHHPSTADEPIEAIVNDEPAPEVKAPVKKSNRKKSKEAEL